MKLQDIGLETYEQGRGYRVVCETGEESRAIHEKGGMPGFCIEEDENWIFRYNNTRYRLLGGRWGGDEIEIVEEQFIENAFKLYYECQIIKNLNKYGISKQEQLNKLEQLILDDNKELFVKENK